MSSQTVLLRTTLTRTIVLYFMIIFYYNFIQENSLVDETNHTASVFTKVIWLYINFVKITDLKIPCKFFVPTSKSFQSYHAWYEEGGSNMEVWYSCKRKWQWEYIKNYYYSMTILPRSTNSIGWQLYLVVKDVENSVYGNIMQLLMELIWFHLLRFPKVVCTDYPLGQTKRPCSKSTWQKWLTKSLKIQFLLILKTMKNLVQSCLIII